MDIPKSCYSTIMGGFKLIHQQEGGKGGSQLYGHFVYYSTGVITLHCTTGEVVIFSHVL